MLTVRSALLLRADGQDCDTTVHCIALFYLPLILSAIAVAIHQQVEKSKSPAVYMRQKLITNMHEDCMNIEESSVGHLSVKTYYILNKCQTTFYVF